jgi:hypothetical protein
MCLKIQRNNSSRNSKTLSFHKNLIKIKKMKTMRMILKISKKRFKSRQSREKCLLSSLNPCKVCKCFHRYTNSMLTLNNLLFKYPKDCIQVANRITIICTIKTIQFNRQNFKIMRSITLIIRTSNSLRYIAIAVILYTPAEI